MGNNSNGKLHNVEIRNREVMVLTGVEKVKNINPNIFIAKINGYSITVQGNNLELNKLDIDSGEVVISGIINSLKYGGATNNQSILKRIFK